MKKVLFITMLCVYAMSFGQDLNENYLVEKGHWNVRGNVSFFYNQ